MTLQAIVAVSALLLWQTTRAETYIFSMMENSVLNNIYPVGKLYVMNPGDDAVVVNVSTPLIYSGPSHVQEVVNISAGCHHVIILPYELHLRGNGIGQKGIFINSTSRIVAQLLNAGSFLTDAIRIPSTEELSRKHFVVSYRYSASQTLQGPYSLAAVATQDNTWVNVTLTPGGGLVSVHLGFLSTHTSGDSIAFTLDKYQTLQIQADWETDGGDLTGTRIWGTNPLMVTSGVTKGAVEVEESIGHLVSTIPSTRKLGMQYIVVPFNDKNSHDVIRILAANNDCSLTVTRDDGQQTSHAIPNFHHHDFLAISSNVYSINSTEKIMVVQFYRGHKHNKSGSSPSMVVLTPVSMWGNTCVFSPMTDEDDDSFETSINIVTTADAKDELELDGDGIDGDWVSIDGGLFVGLQYDIDNDEETRILRHTQGKHFSATLYGSTGTKSYVLPVTCWDETPAESSVSMSSSTAALTELTSVTNHINSETHEAETSAALSTVTENITSGTPMVANTSSSHSPDYTSSGISGDPHNHPNTSMWTTPSTMWDESNVSNVSGRLSSYPSISLSGQRTNFTITTEITGTLNYSETVSVGSTTGFGGGQGNHNPVHIAQTSLKAKSSTKLSSYYDVSSEPTTVTSRSSSYTNLNFGEWTYWTNCSGSCGVGIRYRVKLPAESDLHFYSISDIVVDKDGCSSVCLHRVWSAWTSWSECSRTCGFGLRTRERHDTRDSARKVPQTEICQSMECTEISDELVKEDVAEPSPWKQADNRVSAKVTGGVAGGIIGAMAALIFLSDIPTFYKHLIGT